MDISLILRSIVSLKEFIFITLMFSLIIALYLNYTGRHYQRNKKNRFIHLFFFIDKISMIKVIFFFLYYTFYISCIIRFQPLLMIHIYLFIILTVILVILNMNIKMAISIILNHILQFAALMVLNLLLNYILNVKMNIYFMIVYAVSGIGLILYSTYLLLYFLKSISQGRVVYEKK